MTTWRDDLSRVVFFDGRRLIGASFRGVPFFVEAAERSGGRRAVVHEFPGRDDPYVEDLGRRARTFSVDAYVLGDGYVQQRDALLDALEDVSGPGNLVHPYHGRRVAICTSVATRESQADGGVARLSIEFAEAPAQGVAPAEDLALEERVDISADAALVASEAEFLDAFDVAGLPLFAVASAAADLATMADSLGDALGPIVTATQELARLDVAIRDLTSRAATLVRTPASVVGAFQAALAGLEDTIASSPEKVLRALLDAYGAPTGSLAPETTLTRMRERANQLALTAALRRLLAIEAARLAAAARFSSLDEAAGLRDRITALLEAEAEVAGDLAYPALVQLRADLAAAVPGDAVLARLQTIEQRTAIPSLLLAYQLYGSVEEEADLLARNSIRHPGAVSGTLRVLSDA